MELSGLGVDAFAAAEASLGILQDMLMQLVRAGTVLPPLTKTFLQQPSIETAMRYFTPTRHTGEGEALVLDDIIDPGMHLRKMKDGCDLVYTVDNQVLYGEERMPGLAALFTLAPSLTCIACVKGRNQCVPWTVPGWRYC